jgi:hypothetical protein
VVSSDELPFYQVVSAHDKKLITSTTPIANEPGFLATHAANRVFPGYKVGLIITSAAKNDSDRFYLYTKITD